MAFTPVAVPKSILGYHRVLSPTAGVRVSPLCLGVMNFVISKVCTVRKQAMGECNKETAFEILDYFFEQGENFIDTLKNSINTSLKKLGADYIDLFFVHWWDFTASTPKLMQSLNHLIAAGKVLYLGISDTPAWVVVKANYYAREHGLTPFSVYQGKWNAATRDFERDILPMCENEGMGIAPWGVLGSGDFKTAEQREEDTGEGRKMFPPKERNALVAGKLDEIAWRKGTVLTSVALAYIMHKDPCLYPIIGGRKLSHLKGNIEALIVELSDEEVDEIDGVAEFDVGWPMNMLFAADPDSDRLCGEVGCAGEGQIDQAEEVRVEDL
ncbi:NADP-dependent oxidoreductase domain-containing protein [Rhexocercosporidium sp. MPI-PUGE-AT-0058]|nr:NADP-dependent oxidoreductase domain-containing protein [Rhexocercosporidium sp. MPI-PUGE-AT-0058]